MKGLSIILISLGMAGFVLPDNSCGQTDPVNRDDGPYVLYRQGRIVVYNIESRGENLKLKRDNFDESHKSKIILKVQTEELGGFFRFPLQKEIKEQAAIYPEPSKMLILSDIEANFTAFRKLLLEGQVIDSNFNWTFGSGHLVLTGDFVDRGNQQTEVLWLIYSLEEKAREAGGYVHYILGNHEIMNLSGDLRYLQPKYHDAAALIETGYTSLIGPDSEIGRWLRSKNVVEKIGNILFTHGGISSSINILQMPADTINQLCRPFYGDSLYQYLDPRQETLYGEDGPFWFRGYYKGATGLELPMIDSTLSIYHVSHIATGHTIVADTISVFYDHKIFNTDVHHAGGHTEALLKENGHFYRLVKGEKKWLF
ncbi:MAG: metallophosphoesterase [Chitinophagaceae bacterium]|nr:metallophosphoesterase [Chitinophagaceae bacterium]